MVLGNLLVDDVVFPDGRVVDSTGADDTFAAGTLAGLLEGDAPSAALSRGVVAASFALSGWGPGALLECTRDRAAARRREWYGA